MRIMCPERADVVEAVYLSSLGNEDLFNRCVRHRRGRDGPDANSPPEAVLLLLSRLLSSSMCITRTI